MFNKDSVWFRVISFIVNTAQKERVRGKGYELTVKVGQAGKLGRRSATWSQPGEQMQSLYKYRNLSLL